MAHVQRMPQPIERLGPASRLAPLRQCSRAGQSAGLALQHVKIVLQIEYLLLAAEAAFVASDTPTFVPQLDKIGVHPCLHLASRSQRYRVTVGPHAHAAQPVYPR